ncbi:MAG: hypothetical protein EOP49_10560, partial [Sphingobacteriales bacterium]
MKQFNAAFQVRVLKNSKIFFLLLLTFSGLTSLFAQGPVISYTPLANTCDVATNQTLTVNITDADGVPTSGAGLPHLYWKVNAGGTYSAVTGTSIGANNYTFSFGAGSAGQVIYYYIVAQDNAGNLSV